MAGCTITRARARRLSRWMLLLFLGSFLLASLGHHCHPSGLSGLQTGSPVARARHSGETTLRHPCLACAWEHSTLATPLVRQPGLHLLPPALPPVPRRARQTRLAPARRTAARAPPYS